MQLLSPEIYCLDCNVITRLPSPSIYTQERMHMVGYWARGHEILCFHRQLHAPTLASLKVYQR